MSVGKGLLARMQEAKNHNPSSDVRERQFFVNETHDDIKVSVKFKEAEKLGVVLDYLAISRTEPLLDSSSINEQLEQQAEAVQQNITFLLEDFRLLELDRQNKRAQLRSYPPQADENSKYYYEIVLEDGSDAHFCRYQFNRNQKRFTRIHSQLSGETFIRLTDKLIDIIRETYE